MDVLGKRPLRQPIPRGGRRRGCYQLAALFIRCPSSHRCCLDMVGAVRPAARCPLPAARCPGHAGRRPSVSGLSFSRFPPWARCSVSHVVDRARDESVGLCCPDLADVVVGVRPQRVFSLRAKLWAVMHHQTVGPNSEAIHRRMDSHGAPARGSAPCTSDRTPFPDHWWCADAPGVRRRWVIGFRAGSLRYPLAEYVPG